MIRNMEVNRKRWLKYELGKRKTKLVIKTYARMLISGKIEWEKLGNLYRPDQKIPVATFKRLLRQEETQKMVSEELEKLLSDEDVTGKYSIQGRKKVFELAMEKKDLTNANRSLDAFDSMLDLKPDTKKFIQTTEIDFSHLLPDAYKEDKSLPPGE